MCLIVDINGSPRAGSKTGVLLRAVANAISKKIEARRESIDLAANGPEVLSGLMRDKISPKGEEMVRAAERADLLIVGSPVYRGSYTGLFKHFFDLVDRDCMAGRKAVLVSTGGSSLHGLVLEHQFRPLMGFFNIQTVATALFGVETDFEDGKIQSESLLRRVERAAGEAANLLAHAAPQPSRS